MNIAIHLKRHFRIATDTALHASKDFAVSLLSRLRLILIAENPSLSASASLLAPLGLPGRELPATVLNVPKDKGMFGLSSPCGAIV